MGSLAGAVPAEGGSGTSWTVHLGNSRTPLLGRMQAAMTQGEHQPVGGGMQDESHLVGKWGAARGAVGGELALVQLDQILGLAAFAIESVIEPLCAAGGDAGDDEADVEAHDTGLNASGDAALAVPGLGAVAGLGVAAQHVCLGLGVAHPDIVSGELDQPGQDGVAGEAENVIDIVLLAPSHRFRPTIMAVTTDGDAVRGQ